jgi:aspartate aminotransferase-like enzyme
MNDAAPAFDTFFVPGPTDVRPEVLQAMARAMIVHRSAEFSEMFRRAQAGLKVVFCTEQPVVIATSSSTGLMEGAIRNAPPGRIFSLVNGGFSDRFARIAAACGRSVDRYEVPWGEAHNPSEVARRLAAGEYSTVTVIHSETSTGVLNDVRAISDAAHAAGAVCCIDSVSGIRGAELRFDEWHLDFVLTGSQKAIALPPGLAFGVASPAFLAAGQREGRGVYFDFSEIVGAANRNEAPNTPALPIHYALDEQVPWILAEGIEAAWARHAAMAQATVQWVEDFRASGDVDLSIVAAEGHRSPTVTAISLPSGLSPDTVIRGAAERGYTVGAGYGKLQPTTIRIGHMGDHTLDGLARCLEVVGDVIASAGVAR